MKKILLNFFAVFILFASACSTTYRVADLTVVSTKNIDVNNIDLNKVSQKKNVVGKDSKWFFLVVPVTAANPTIYKAVDNALSKGNGNLMINTVIYGETSFFFPFIKISYTAKGTIINTNGGQNE